MRCDHSLYVWVTAVNTVITVTMVSLFFFTVYLVFISRRVFHPFFVMFFIPFLLCYCVCDSSTVIKEVALAFDISDDAALFLVADNLALIFYRIATPLIIFLLLERLYATKYSQSYEKSRPWLLFGPLLPLGLIFSVADDLFLYYDLVSAEVEQYSLGILQVVIITLLFLLLHINRRLVAQQTGRGASLTSRYQISENIRALRLVLPVVVLDGLLTMEYILFDLFLGVDRQFDIDLCSQDPNYFIWYIIVNFITYFLEVLIPIFVIYNHPVIGDAARRIFNRKDVESKRFDSENREEICRRITNVLGVDMRQVQTSREYFDILNNYWK